MREKYKLDLNINKVYYVEQTGYENGYFIVYLESDKNNFIKLKWDYILSYCETDESYRPDFWVSDFSDYYPLYFTDDSKYINYIKDLNENDEKLLHFTAVGGDSIVDIISYEHPEIIIIDENNKKKGK